MHRDRYFLLIVGLALVPIAMYWGTVGTMAELWSTEAHRHGYVIPIISLGLLWRDRSRYTSIDFRGSWLGAAHYAPTGLPALEWSRYHERGYQATNLGLSIALGSSRWSVRVGNTRAEGQSQPYIGIAYNGF